jgi:hypothetical protein
MFEFELKSLKQSLQRPIQALCKHRDRPEDRLPAVPVTIPTDESIDHPADERGDDPANHPTARR